MERKIHYLFTFLSAFILLPTLYAQTQQPIGKWIRSVSGADTIEARAVNLDHDGRVFTLGRFNGTADFDIGQGTDLRTAVGDYDIFLMKQNNDGNHIWTRQFGGTGFDDPTGLAIEPTTRDIYIVGGFDGTVDFDPGAGQAMKTSAGDADIFIVSLNHLGNFNWVETIGGTGNDYAEAIAILPGRHIAVIGNFEGTVDFDPDLPTHSLTSLGGYDMFIGIYDLLGGYRWAGALRGQGTSEERGYDIAMDADGNIYATGGFEGSVDFDPKIGDATRASQPGSEDIFLVKLDSSCSFDWVKIYGSPGIDYGFGLAVDDLQNCYVAGTFSDSAHFGAATVSPHHGVVDAFILKTDADGNERWLYTCGGSDADIFKDIALEDGNHTYITAVGTFSQQATLRAAPPAVNVISNGGEDVFVVRLDSAGELTVGYSYGGSGDDSGEEIIVPGINTTYLVGAYEDTVNFALSTFGPLFTLNAAGGADSYTFKLGNVLLAAPELANEAVLEVFPNPTEGFVRFRTGEAAPGSWSLRDLQGKVQLQGAFEAAEEGLLDMQALPAGVYLLEVQQDDLRGVRRILKL